jgi:hypothetical protein
MPAATLRAGKAGKQAIGTTAAACHTAKKR